MELGDRAYTDLAKRMENVTESVIKNFILPDLDQKIERIVQDSILRAIESIHPGSLTAMIRDAVRSELMSKIEVRIKE